MKKTKNFLCFILIFLFTFTFISFISAKVSAHETNQIDASNLLGEKISLSAENESASMKIYLQAPEDGFYSARIKAEEKNGGAYIGKTYYDNATECTPYASDYRLSDRASINYYQLKKGESIILSFSASSHTDACIIVDVVEKIQPGQKISFNGEYDKSYYFDPDSSPSFYKFGCLVPTDSNDNNLLYERVRYFQNENNNELDYLNIPDVPVNTAMSIYDMKNLPFIFNIYSYKTSYSTEDISTVTSEVQFIKTARIKKNRFKYG